MTDITPVQASTLIADVPGLTPSNMEALKAIMAHMPQWDSPFPFSNDTATQALQASRQMVSRHLNALEAAGLISVASSGRIRHISIKYDAISGYLGITEYVNHMSTSEPDVPSGFPLLCRHIPRHIPRQNDGTVTGNNGIPMPRTSICFLESKENKESKENIRIYIPSSILFSFSGLQCDLNPLIADAGLQRLTPFGDAHSWKFDFQQLYDLLDPDPVKAMQLRDKYEWLTYHYMADHFQQSRYDFFLMSLAIELACHTDDCFLLPSKLDPAGNNFSDFWEEQQQGLIFTCISACYPDNDCSAIMRHVKSTWRPSRGKSLLEYTGIVLRNELIDLMNYPGTAMRCFKAFNQAFRTWACTQGYLNHAKTRPMNHPQWLEGIWGPDLSTGLACTLTYGYKPRLTAPMLLMRQLIGMNETGNLWQCHGESAYYGAAGMMYQAFRTEPYASQYRQLATMLADKAPWMSHMYQPAGEIQP